MAAISVCQVFFSKLLVASTSILPFPTSKTASCNRRLLLKKTISPFPLMVSPEVLASGMRNCNDTLGLAIVPVAVPSLFTFPTVILSGNG